MKRNTAMISKSCCFFQMIQNFQEEACFILDTMKGNEILKHALTLIVSLRVCEMGYHVPWHTQII